MWVGYGLVYYDKVIRPTLPVALPFLTIAPTRPFLGEHRYSA